MKFSSTAAAAAALPLAFAQTYTSCNPLDKVCPSDTGLNAASFETDFTAGANSAWSEAAGTTLSYGSDGAEFTVHSVGQAPTIQTNWYFLFGHVDVVMKAAPGVGVISSIVLESDDLDEIDWEFLGGDNTQAETNYFGKGNTTTYNRATYVSVPSPTTEYHTYSVDWTAERLQYLIDGNLVRTLEYADAVGGKNYPQTPMRVKLGNWTPPPTATGTIQWAGGPVQWDQAPFSMYVKSVSVQNYNPASSYTYGDMSGSWQSIQIDGKSAGSGSSGSSGSASSSSVVGTGSASASVASTATLAPTSSHKVIPLQQTGVAVSSTILQSTVSSTSSSMSTSYSASATSNNGTSASGKPAQQTGTNAAASLHGSFVAVSMLSAALGLFLL